MIKRIFSNKKVLLCGLLTEVAPDHDKIEKYKELRGLYLEDGWERVKAIFSRDDFGELHPELVNSIQMAQLGFFVGAFIGGTVTSFKSISDFLNNNDATLFFTKRDAYKQLYIKSVLSFGKGILTLGPHFSIFLGGFYLFSSCYEAYRNRSGVIEYTVGGVGVGALCRIHYGIRGMLSGGIVGGTLGTIVGLAQLGVQKLFKVDAMELKYAQFALKKYRESLEIRGKIDNSEEISLPPEATHIVIHNQNPLDSLEVDSTEEVKKDVPVENKKDREKK